MKLSFALLFISVAALVVVNLVPVLASPYGSGLYGDNIPYGDQTSISIATSGTVSINVTPTVGGQEASQNDTVTVTTTDVAGYTLNLKDNDTSLNLTKVSDTIVPVSSGDCTANWNNDASLGANTWGYKADGQGEASEYCAILTSAGSGHNIKSTSTIAPSGSNTTVTYAVKVTTAKPSGIYSDAVLYTATGNTP